MFAFLSHSGHLIVAGRSLRTGSPKFSSAYAYVGTVLELPLLQKTVERVECEGIRPVAPAIDAHPHDTARIDDPGLGEELGAVLVAHDLAVGIEQQLEPELRWKQRRDLAEVPIGGDGDDLDVVAARGQVRELEEAGQLFHARLTGDRPEVHHHDLAALVAQPP